MSVLPKPDYSRSHVSDLANLPLLMKSAKNGGNLGNNFKDRSTLPTIPKIRSFLCCFSLETGSKLIAWFHSIISILFTLGCVFMISKSYLFANKTDEACVYVSTFIFGLISIIVGIELIIGLKKKITVYVRWYLTYMAAIIFFDMLSIIGVTMNFAISNNIVNENCANTLSVLLIIFVISTYFFLVVFNYYRDNKAIWKKNKDLHKSLYF